MINPVTGQVCSLCSGAGFDPRHQLNLHFICPAYKGGQAGSDYALFGAKLLDMPWRMDSQVVPNEFQTDSVSSSVPVCNHSMGLIASKLL